MVYKQRNVIIFYKHKVNKYKVIDQINVIKMYYATCFI